MKKTFDSFPSLLKIHVLETGTLSDHSDREFVFRQLNCVMCEPLGIHPISATISVTLWPGNAEAEL